MSGDQIAERLIVYLLVVGSLAFHEWGHAYMADRLGDGTPRSQGRVTLNPLAHIDLIGTVLLPLAGAFGFFGGFAMIGWAKPVMIDPRNLPRVADRAWVTIAGPAMNLLLGIAFAVAAAVASRFDGRLEELCWLAVRVNVTLMIFNLLPIPPLDGSKFLMYWGRMSEETYARFANFGWVILIVCINLPGFAGYFLWLRETALQPFKAIYGILT